MTKEKGSGCSSKKAEEAFKLAICRFECKDSSRKVAKCITEEGGCNRYKIFIKKINS